MSDVLKARLRSSGLRVTPQRMRVLAVLEVAARPLAHADILQQFGDESMDRVTLYRVLSSLSDCGIVHQVQGSDGIWRFCFHESDGDRCPGGHAHFLCEQCGTMMCLHDCALPHVDVPASCEVRHKQMLVVGRCAACRAQNAEVSPQTSQKKDAAYEGGTPE